MKRSALLPLLLLASACTDTEARTQVMLEVEADDGVRARLAALRILVAVSDDNGNHWQKSVDETFDADDVRWPARLGFVPKGGDADRIFAVRVQAFDASDRLFVWRQAVAGFARGRTTALRVALTSECDVSALECGDPACVGFDDCMTCSDGDCIDVKLMPLLPNYDPDFKADAGSSDSGMSPPDGDGMVPDDAGDAGDGSMPDEPEDGGDGSMPGEDGGTDAGCTTCDAGEPEPFEATVDDDSIELNAPIEIEFNADVDENTVSSLTVAVSRHGEPVLGELDVDGDTITFQPDDVLGMAATYRIELGSGLSDESGRELEDVTLEITTRDCEWDAHEVATASNPYVTSTDNGFSVLGYDVLSPASDPFHVVVASTYAPGDGWASAVQVSGTSTNFSYFQPTLSANDDGQIAAAFYYDTQGTVYTGQRTAAGVWSNAFAVGGGGAWGTRVYMRPDGTFDFVYLNGGSLSSKSGSNMASSLSSMAGNSFALTPFDDRALVVWSEGATLRSITTGGGVFSDRALDATPSTIAADSDPFATSAVAVWRQTDASWTNIWSSRRVVHSAWSMPVRVSNDTAAASAPAVGVDGRGRAIAVWQQGPDATSRIQAATFVPGNAWATPAPISDLAEGPASVPRIVVDAGGNAFAFWLADPGTGDELWVARYNADDGWQLAARRSLSTEGTGASSVSASIDNVGRAHVAWSEGALIRAADCE